MQKELQKSMTNNVFLKKRVKTQKKNTKKHKKANIKILARAEN